MQINNIKLIITILILAVAFSAVMFLEKANSVTLSSKDCSSFPKQIGAWTGEDLPIEENVYEVLKTRDVLLRKYTDSEDNEILLTLVYSENDRAAFHPPELCYLGGGVQLLEKKVEAIPLLGGSQMKVNTLSMKDKQSIFKAWYWFAAGETFTHNFYFQQLTLLSNWLRYHEKSGALIRVSAVMNPNKVQETEGLVYKFIQEALPSIKVFLKKT
jgi:EpsI family protein